MTRNGWYKMQHKCAPYIFVAPFIIVFVIFLAYPLIQSLVLATFITNGPKSRVFVGLGNLTFMLSDPDFYIAVKNTVVFALFSVFLQLPLSLGLALLLNNALVKGRNFFRFAFFSPHLVGRVFVAVMFTIMFAPKYGLINKTIDFIYPAFDIDLNWLETQDMVMPALVLTALWL